MPICLSLSLSLRLEAVAIRLLLSLSLFQTSRPLPALYLLDGMAGPEHVTRSASRHIDRVVSAVYSEAAQHLIACRAQLPCPQQAPVVAHLWGGCRS